MPQGPFSLDQPRLLTEQEAHWASAGSQVKASRQGRQGPCFGPEDGPKKQASLQHRWAASRADGACRGGWGDGPCQTVTRAAAPGPGSLVEEPFHLSGGSRKNQVPGPYGGSLNYCQNLKKI